jgi:hypothetical protein
MSEVITKFRCECCGHDRIVYPIQYGDKNGNPYIAYWCKGCAKTNSHSIDGFNPVKIVRPQENVNLQERTGG